MARDVSGSDPCLCALQECDWSCHAAPQIDNDLHCNHCCLRPCDDSWTDLDRDGENGISPELLHHRRQIADAVWQSDQLCALAMGHYRAGRAIRSQTHDPRFMVDGDFARLEAKCPSLQISKTTFPTCI